MITRNLTIATLFASCVLGLAIATTDLQAAGDHGSIVWERDITKALATAKKENKLVFMDIYADWCGPCKMMDSNTFTDASVQKKLENYVTIKVNSDENADVAREYGTGSLPTLTVINADGAPITQQAGYMPPDAFVEFLGGVEARLARITELEATLTTGPNDILKVMDLASEFIAMRQPEKALAWLEKIRPEAEKDLQSDAHGDLLFNLGLAQLMSEQYALGVQTLRQFTSSHPDHPLTPKGSDLILRGMLFQARALVNEDKFSEARDIFANLAETDADPGLAQFAAQQLDELGLLGESAPEFAVTEWMHGGSDITLGQLKGKVVLLNFFQIICPGCERARPEIVKLRESYSTQGLEVLGIATAFEELEKQQPDAIRAFVKEKKIPYPTAIDQELKSTFTSYQAGGSPWTILIDKKGIVRYSAFFDPQGVEDKVQQLLKENQV